jgi:hypothetical protein
MDGDRMSEEVTEKPHTPFVVGGIYEKAVRSKEPPHTVQYVMSGVLLGGSSLRPIRDGQIYTSAVGQVYVREKHELDQWELTHEPTPVGWRTAMDAELAAALERVRVLEERVDRELSATGRPAAPAASADALKATSARARSRLEGAVNGDAGGNV